MYIAAIRLPLSCLALLVGILVLSLLIAPVTSAQAAPQPNIVVIMTDDQDTASVATMPFLRTLVQKQGVTFTNSFVNFALCCPSRATFLTGQHSINNHVEDNALPSGGYTKLNHTNTLPIWLQGAGYKTALVGKYLNRYGQDVPPTTVPPGWALWHGSLTLDKYRNGTVNHNGIVQSYTGYNTDHFTAVATDFITEQTNVAQPFFLWLTYDAPHYPAVPADRHKGMFASAPLPMPPSFNEPNVSDKPPGVRWPLMTPERITTIQTQYRLRLKSLQAVDEGVKEIIDALQSAGKLNNTVVIFTSDNGYFQGHHRIPDQKDSYYEEAIRVPLMIRGPGIPTNVQRTKLVSNIDLAPTMVALAGATSGRTMDGTSLLPLIHTPTAPWRTALFIDGKARVPLGTDPPLFNAVRTSRYLYVEHQAGAKEFYDLQTDPYQLQSKPTNSAYAGVITDLRSKLQTLKTCFGATCWVTSPELAP